jgi:hypothetical protein
MVLQPTNLPRAPQVANYYTKYLVVVVGSGMLKSSAAVTEGNYEK